MIKRWVTTETTNMVAKDWEVLDKKIFLVLFGIKMHGDFRQLKLFGKKKKAFKNKNEYHFQYFYGMKALTVWLSFRSITWLSFLTFCHMLFGALYLIDWLNVELSDIWLKFTSEHICSKITFFFENVDWVMKYGHTRETIVLTNFPLFENDW